MPIILAPGKNHGPVTTADFPNLGKNLIAEMAKSSYSSTTPYATTFSANHKQTMALDILNKKLDLYFAKKIKKQDVADAFESAKSVLAGSGLAVPFKAMLQQMEQNFSNKDQCTGRIIAITTMMRSGGGGPVTAREEQDNITRVKSAVQKYQFHVLTNASSDPALPDSIKDIGIAAAKYSEKDAAGQKIEGKYKPYWENRRATNKWLKQLMSTSSVPKNNPVYDTSYKHEDYEKYAKKDYKPSTLLRMYGGNKNKNETIIQIGNTVAVVGLFTMAGCSIAYAIIPGVNLFILGIAATVGSVMALSGIITNLVCSEKNISAEDKDSKASARP